MDDYPNAGQAVGVYPTAPDTVQTAKGRAEEAMIGSALPIIEDILQWFNSEIHAVNAIHNIDLRAKVSVEAQILAFQEITRILTEKRDEFQTKFEAYKALREERRGA